MADYQENYLKMLSGTQTSYIAEDNLLLSTTGRVTFSNGILTLTPGIIFQPNHTYKLIAVYESVGAQ